MTILGSILMMAGIALSLAAFVHDVRRLRTGRELGGQAAPSRIAPEVHAVAAPALTAAAPAHGMAAVDQPMAKLLSSL